MFLNGCPPHTLGFGCGHGLKKVEVFRRIFERHEAYFGGLLLFGESCFHRTVCLWRHRALALWTAGSCLATLVDISVEAGGLGVSFVHFRVLLPL